MDKNSLAHTKWNCKYHIVFTPKYRRQAIYGKIKKDIGAILRKLCEFKGVEIIVPKEALEAKEEKSPEEQLKESEKIENTKIENKVDKK